MGRESETEQTLQDEYLAESNETKIDVAENTNKILLLDSSCETSNEKIEPQINCCDNKTLLIKTVLSGQVLSLMLCSTGTAATALSNIYNVRVPCFNAFTMYTILALTFGINTLRSRNFTVLIKQHWWKYLIVSFMDVEANFLLTKAYSYTTMTSVQLCDSFTIPTVMTISFIFLRVRYKIIHYAGVIICISGAVCLVFTDSSENKGVGSNSIYGDVMALCAAVLYGSSQVGQEYLVKKYSWKEYLGIIGLCGFLISGIQTVCVEKDVIANIEWSWQNGLVLLAFAVSQFFYYSIMPLVMILSSATVVNLSILTSDLYTLIVGLFLFGYKFSYMYFIAFAGIFVGLITYNIRPVPHAPPRKTKRKRHCENTDAITITEFKQRKWYCSFLQKGVREPLLNGTKHCTYTNL